MVDETDQVTADATVRVRHLDGDSVDQETMERPVLDDE